VEGKKIESELEYDDAGSCVEGTRV